MAETYQLQIVLLEGVVFDEQVESIVAPVEDGFVGVLAHHAPLLTTLREGPLKVRGGEEEKVFFLGGGLLEVIRNRATILADSAKPM